MQRLTGAVIKLPEQGTSTGEETSVHIIGPFYSTQVVVQYSSDCFDIWTLLCFSLPRGESARWLRRVPAPLPPPRPQTFQFCLTAASRADSRPTPRAAARCSRCSHAPLSRPAKTATPTAAQTTHQPMHQPQHTFLSTGLVVQVNQVYFQQRYITVFLQLMNLKCLSAAQRSKDCKTQPLETKRLDIPHQ